MSRSSSPSRLVDSVIMERKPRGTELRPGSNAEQPAEKQARICLSADDFWETQIQNWSEEQPQPAVHEAKSMPGQPSSSGAVQEISPPAPSEVVAPTDAGNVIAHQSAQISQLVSSLPQLTIMHHSVLLLL